MMKTLAAAVVSLSVLAIAPALANDYRCGGKKCPAPRPHYDSQEVVHTTQDIDRSRVINTQSVVEVPSGKPVRVHNHLVIRKNTIRNVGVVRHRHTIIEKEIRYKRRAPAHVQRVYARAVTVNFVTQKYRTVHRPALVDAVTVYPRCKSCRVLRVRG
jgi:hypothetical protein